MAETLHRQYNARNDRGDFNRRVDENRDLNATARAQIENRDAYESAMDAHVRVWRLEHQKLSNMSHHIPEFDLSSKGHRNLLNEYEERRTHWERGADVIDEKYSAHRDNIRGLGKTLKGEFEVPERDRSPTRSR